MVKRSAEVWFSFPSTLPPIRPSRSNTVFCATSERFNGIQPGGGGDQIKRTRAALVQHLRVHGPGYQRYRSHPRRRRQMNLNVIDVGQVWARGPVDGRPTSLNLNDPQFTRPVFKHAALTTWKRALKRVRFRINWPCDDGVASGH